MDQPALRVSGVAKSYGPIVALAGVDVAVAPGEILGLLGSNGAGKTTLLSIVAGLRRPDAGRVDVLGIDAFAEPRHARERVGLVPQQLGIYPSLTVRENLQLFGELGGLRGEALAGRLEEVAAAFGLERLAGRQARRLSGGEQRRLHIAMALVRRRPLLLLDEPLAGLDPDWRGSVLELEGRLASEGVAVCHATNDPGEVEALGGRVAVLEAGRMVSGGRVHDVAPA